MTRVRNLDVAMLRSFAVVADRASMTRAAEALNLTQGAVSQQIRRLEDDFGGRLFDRHDKGVRLTRAGEHLLGPVRRLLAEHDALCAEVFGERVEGRVAVGVPYDLAANFIGPVLRPFTETHPGVEVSLVCASSPELLEALGKRKIDLALVEEPVGPTAGERLRVDRLVWTGAPGGIAHTRDPLPVSIVSERCAFRSAIVEGLDGGPRAWRSVYENVGLEATLAAVRSDLAVTAWLSTLVPSDLTILAASARLPELPAFAINLHVAAGDVARPAAQLADHIREHVLNA